MGLFSKLFPKKKPKTGGVFRPKFFAKARVSDTTITDPSVNRANTDLTDLRYGADAKEIIREYAKVSPDVSQALNTYIRFIITDSYTVFAKGLETDQIDPEATVLARQFITRLNSLPSDYQGFSQAKSIEALSETLIMQLLLNGCAMAELVFDAARLPNRIQVISTNDLKFRQRGDRITPFVVVNGVEYDLDTPAVKYISLNQDPDKAYSDSWFEAAIQAIISSEEYRGDVRRAFRKASLPRVTASIDLEKFQSSLPPEVLYDQDKLKAAMNGVIDEIENQLNNLNPEDCLVFFDTVDVDHLSQGNTSTHDSLRVHSQLVNGLVASGLKILPSLLGRGESQTTASTESVLFLKVCEGLQGRLNEMFSQLLTLALRVMGHDVVVTFKYRKPDLRPEIELESFYAMRQSRILQRLSLGLDSDEEASITLTGDLPGPEYKPLSGTGFFSGNLQTADNPYSNTSVTGEGINSTQVQKDLDSTKTQPKSNGTTGK